MRQNKERASSPNLVVMIHNSQLDLIHNTCFNWVTNSLRAKKEKIQLPTIRKKEFKTLEKLKLDSEGNANNSTSVSAKSRSRKFNFFFCTLASQKMK